MANNFVARQDFSIPTEWELQKIAGRDFWVTFQTFYRGAYRKDRDYDPLAYAYAPDVLVKADKATDEIKRLAEIPAFNDTALNIVMYRGWTENKDGSVTMILPRVPKGLGDRPLFLNVGYYARLGQNAMRVLAGDIKNNRKEFEKWREQNPNFAGFISGLEWLGDISQAPMALDILTGRFNDPNHWMVKVCLKNEKPVEISDAEYEKIKKEWFPDTVMEAKQHRLGTAEKYVKRLAEMCFDDPSLQVFGDGHIASYHLVGKWGAKIIWMETSRPWQMWQNQMISARGASRQFNKPWFWYVASYGNGYDNKGKFISGNYSVIQYEGKEPNSSPFNGVSPSGIRRVFYMTYFSGANIMEREGDTCAYFTSFKFDKLSRQGQDYVDFYNFTKANPDRGTPYTPIALLSPWDKLSLRGGKYSGTAGGAMHHAFLCSIFRMFPDKYLTSKYPDYGYPVMGQDNGGKKDPIQQKEGREWCLANNPYGDVFDQLTPDFDDKSDFKRAIDGYKAAIMLDEFAKDKEMAQILIDYVKRGGTLVINTRQLNELFPKEFTGVALTGETLERNGYTFDGIALAGAKTIKAEAGIPVFIRNDYGNGAVVVTTPRYMIPMPNDKDFLKQYNDAKSGKLIFPYIRELLDNLCGESLPIKVTGDIQFGLNKTRTGWWIYLLNNKGVYRLYGDPEKIDLNRTATVTVDVSRLAPKTVRELFSKEDVPVKNGKVTVTVGPGDLKCLRVDCNH